MTNLHRTFLFVGTVIGMSLIMFPVFAQVAPIVGSNCGFFNCTGNETFGGSIEPFAVLVINTVISLVATLAFAYLVVAAILYITSRGDADRSEKAKRQVVYALIGLILASSAWVIVNAVVTIDAAPIEGLLNAYINVALSLVGLAAVIYIVYAGFKYIVSRGDEEATNSAKRQIVFALIGVFVAGTAAIIVNAIIFTDTTVLLGSIRSVANTVLTLFGTIAVIYIALGGSMYIISQGDEERITRAKMQVIYAVVGLIVVVISAVIVNFLLAAI